VNRSQRQTGYYGHTDLLSFSSSVRHFWEEPPLVGTGGVGNLFITACNMRCDYCQNFQISQDWQNPTDTVSLEQSYQVAAEQMLRLQEDEVHFIGWVSPSHVVPGLLKILSIARERGLETPIIYNTNGYDALVTLNLLDGVVDVYLPDLKYTDSAVAKGISHIHEYPELSRQAALAMYRQIVPLNLREDDMIISPTFFVARSHCGNLGDAVFYLP
jgi:putative pyruvate formate lyase activating enzyme